MADTEPGPPHRSDSQATTISLLRLDPTPIDSPDTESDRPPLVPEEVFESEDEDTYRSTEGTAKPGSIWAPGLSGSGRGAVYYLTRLQKYSSYAMNIFTSLHLCNVSLIPATTGSADASETYLLMTREIYQTALTEPLLVALPLVAHIGSGIALRLLRRRQNMRRYGGATPGVWPVDHRGRNISAWPVLSYISVSGYVLSFFYGAHVFMNRVLPLAVEGDSSNIGLAYVAHGFARHPVLARLAYVGLIGAAAGHMVWGSAKWLGLAPSTAGWLQSWSSGGGEGASRSPAGMVDRKTRRQRRRRWIGVQGVAVGVAALWAVGGLGVVARAGASGGWVATLYDDLFAKIRL